MRGIHIFTGQKRPPKTNDVVVNRDLRFGKTKPVFVMPNIDVLLFA